jgi:phosphatidylserine/phosphatidylglycerophosphate/cardiolipin synthase-like enzyme
MKKILILLLILPTILATNYYVQDQGSVEVHFCPDCQNEFNLFLMQAQESIHCALFELNIPSTKAILKERAKLIDVKIIIDNNYQKKFNTSFTKYDSWGLMHNKFCILDNKLVSTGSMNPTVNGMKKNNNNLILINSKLIAKNYENEFQEMLNNTFKKGNPTKTPGINLNHTKVFTYFCPEDSCADKVIHELRLAKKSIYFMTFSFTHAGIANTILAKHLQGIRIQGIMEARQISKYSQYHRLVRYINVTKDKNKNNMHHKVFIIDNQTVITGSFNPSANGDTRNDENLIIIHNKNIAKQYIEEYFRIR